MIQYQMEKTSQPAASPRRVSVVRLSNLPKVVLYEIELCISRIASKTSTTIESDRERFFSKISTHFHDWSDH